MVGWTVPNFFTEKFFTSRHDHQGGTYMIIIMDGTYMGCPLVHMGPICFLCKRVPRGARGAGRSSGSRTLSCKGLDHLINPTWRMHLQFGLFSVPTSGPQLVHQRLWYGLFLLWEGAYKKPLLVIKESSLCCGSRFPLKLDVQWYENQCALEASLNKTHFPFLINVHVIINMGNSWEGMESIGVP